MAVRRPILLLFLFVAVALAGNYNRHHREKRDNDLHDWLTAEQKEELKDIKQGTPEFKKKVGEFYNALSAEKREEWDKFYRTHCFEWTAKAQNADEETEFQKNVADNDVEKVKARIGELKKDLDEEKRKNVEMWEQDCYELLKPKRTRREIEAAFQDFVKWMTPEQLGDINELKTAGKDSEVQAKVKEFFGQLPADQQATLKEEFKGKCKVYFTPLMTAEELDKIKTLKGDKEAAGALVKGVVDRQTGDVKAVAEKMLGVCAEVYKESSRKRREIESAFQDFVKWMTPEQLGDINALKTAGKDSEVQAKVKEFFGQLPADQQATLKEEFKGKCKVYFTPLMTAEELDKIKTLKGDKEAAGALVKGVVDRQTGDVKAIAEKMLSVCGEVYKDSSRRRREIEPAFQDFVKWMTPEQLGDINALKAAGKESEVQEKVKEFFGQLPAEQQTSLKEEFKGKCRVYFTPLMTSEELEKIKTLKADKEAAGALMKTVVDRQEGEVKSVAEKMLGVCGEVYKQSSRKRREIEAAFQDFVKWMTPEQLGEVESLKAAGKEGPELQAKVTEFFGKLPADQQKTLKEEFKGKCKVYFTPLMTSEELEKIKTLKGDKEAAGALVKGVVDRQIGEVKTISEKMLAVCGEVYKDSTRRRREIEPAFQDFVKWMTPEQLGDITALKTAGKDSEVQEKVKEYFAKLPAEQQATLTEQFKGSCKTYFSPLMTSDESEKIKGFVASGDKEAAKNLVKEVVERQTGEVKNIADKMFGICGEVFKESKSKRDVAAKIEKHLSWLQPAEKEEILKMSKEGKSKEDIKKRLLEIVEAKEKDSDEKAKTVKLCYAWMDDVASKEEIESLHKLHHVDHGACKKKVREFIGRLPEEKQQAVEASLPFCEKLWYGDHASHGGHEGHEGHGDHSGHHHHRRRRHLAVIEKYLEWMDASQKKSIEELESSGADFGVISDKITEFFHLLPAEKQTDLKDKFQHQCMIWAKEVSKPLEWEEIKKHHAAQDYTALKEKLVELEERLTENQKHTIEHVRGTCYKLWGIKNVARRVRVPHSEDSFKEKAEKYLDWMNEEQLTELKRLKSEGKKSEVMKAILKYFDETTGEVHEKAEGKLKEACREYSVKAFGEEKVAEFKKLNERKADKSEMNELADKYISEIEDEKKKEFAQAVVTGCKHVYSSSRSRRDLIAREVAEYLQSPY
ncbi:CBN-NPA-1 protein [Caenorhabditis brenneri]|uniref:CBN-NPA-1 protein n=1 Tax=Caenorhabditis brenneri TaxID=135651 RepID=G0NX67_CAEBE|nr:CBN-NPA-1 protein [Caenorhabditis brenneri]